MYEWLRKLFEGWLAPRPKAKAVQSSVPARTRGEVPMAAQPPEASEPTKAAPPPRVPAAKKRRYRSAARIVEEKLPPLEQREQQALSQIETYIERGELEMPYLPSTSMRVVTMLNDLNIAVDDLVEIISTDPVLSSELLKTANSALFGGHFAVESIREGITRLGLRKLRSMVLAISMRQMIFGFDRLAGHAEEVWRQSFAAAAIAQKIAPHIAFDQEKAFMIGLLHDVGRIPLLNMLCKEAKKLGVVSDALVGRVFHRFHERAGAAVARKWRLNEEIVSVAGCHHRFKENQDHPRSAALASLSHRLDLFESIERARDEEFVYDFPEMDFLKINPKTREEILEEIGATYEVIGWVQPTRA